MAVSDYRQGKWTPTKTSKDSHESGPYTGEIERNRYAFWAIDRSGVEGRFAIGYHGCSVTKLDRTKREACLSGSFELVGCTGVPEQSENMGLFIQALIPDQADQLDGSPFYSKWPELNVRTDPPDNDFTLLNLFTYFVPMSGSNNIGLAEYRGSSAYATPILIQTPRIFIMSPPWHLSYMDKFWLDTFNLPGVSANREFSRVSFFLSGSWLPYFYNDKKRTFFVLPSIEGGGVDRLTHVGGSVRYYYPEIKKGFRQLEDFFEGQVHTWLDSITLPVSGSNERQQWEQVLWQAFPEEADRWSRRMVW